MLTANLDYLVHPFTCVQQLMLSPNSEQNMAYRLAGCPRRREAERKGENEKKKTRHFDDNHKLKEEATGKMAGVTRKHFRGRGFSPVFFIDIDVYVFCFFSPERHMLTDCLVRLYIFIHLKTQNKIHTHTLQQLKGKMLHIHICFVLFIVFKRCFWLINVLKNWVQINIIHI